MCDDCHCSNDSMHAFQVKVCTLTCIFKYWDQQKVLLVFVASSQYSMSILERCSIVCCGLAEDDSDEQDIAKRLMDAGHGDLMLQLWEASRNADFSSAKMLRRKLSDVYKAHSEH